MALSASEQPTNSCQSHLSLLLQLLLIQSIIKRVLGSSGLHAAPWLPHARSVREAVFLSAASNLMNPFIPNPKLFGDYGPL